MKRTSSAKTFAITIAVLALGAAPWARAQEKVCSDATLYGSYAYTATGFNTAGPAPVGPVAEVGKQNFDGKGGTNAVATISGDGTLYQLEIKGSYTLNSDCTGTFSLDVSPFGITVPVYFVIDDGGNEFRAIETGAGSVITRVGKRQFPEHY